MKYLKYLLIIIGVLTILFIGKGLLTPTISYECEVMVNKPIQESWAVMSDASKIPEWIKGFKRTELISGTERTVGAVSNVYVEDSGQEMVMQETVTAVKPEELLAMKFTMDFMNMDYEVFFKEEGNKTLIRSKSITEGNGIFAKSIVSFMPASMKAQEEENLNNLKMVIEKNTKDYFPNPVQESSLEVVNN